MASFDLRVLESIFRIHTIGERLGIDVHRPVRNVATAAQALVQWNLTVAELPNSEIRAALRAVAVGAAENVQGAASLLAAGHLSLVQHALRSLVEARATAAVLGRDHVAASEFNLQAELLSEHRMWELLASVPPDPVTGDDSIAQQARNVLANTPAALLRYQKDRWWAAESWLEWCERKGADWCRINGVTPPNKLRAPTLLELRVMAGLADDEHNRGYDENSSWVHQDPARLVNQSHAGIPHPVAIARDACAVVSQVEALVSTLNKGVVPRLRRSSPSASALRDLEHQMTVARAATDEVYVRDCLPAVRRLVEAEPREST